jgi:hypothetical protein
LTSDSSFLDLTLLNITERICLIQDRSSASMIPIQDY